MASDFKPCSVDGCEGDAGQRSGGRRSFCSRHYWHWKQSRVGLACSIEGCEGSAYAKSFCISHWRKWKFSGNPFGIRTPNGEPQSYFEKTVLPFSSDECLFWPYARDNQGYARMSAEGRMRLVHRIACERVNGPAPTRRHQAAHNCGGGASGCVNPRHTRWATHAENQADRVSHGTSNRGTQQWRSRLSEEDVRAIRELSKSLKQSEIARRFEVDPSHVSDIVNRRRWAWLGQAPAKMM